MGICFHKWKGVPMFDGDLSKIDPWVPTKNDYGFLRKCKKCGQKSAKCWVTILIPIIKVVPLCEAYTTNGKSVFKSFNKSLIITTKEIKLFRIWKNN